MYVSMHLCSKASLLSVVAHSFVIIPAELIAQPKNVSGVTVCSFGCFLPFPGEKCAGDMTNKNHSDTSRHFLSTSWTATVSRTGDYVDRAQRQ